MIMFNIDDLIDFLATKEVMIVLAIIGLILFAYFVLWFYEFIKKQETKKRLQNNTMELKKLVEEVAKEDTTKEVVQLKKEEPVISPVVDDVKEEEKPQEVEQVVIQNIPSPVEVKPVVVSTTEVPPTTNDSIMLNGVFEEKVEVIEPVKTIPVDSPKNEEEVIKYKDEVYTESEAKQELERLKEELTKLEEEEKSENIELTKYETEQEENAIISLDELLTKGKTLTSLNEVREYQDDGNEPISIDELEERYKNSKEIVEVLEDVEEAKPKVSIDDFLGVKNSTPKEVHAYQEKKSSYQPSPIISPVYGIQKEPIKKNTTLELEDTANFEKFDEEIRKTNEFLSQLKELQQKLD